MVILRAKRSKVGMALLAPLADRSGHELRGPEAKRLDWLFCQ